MNKQTIITILLALVTTTSVLAQNLIKTATTPVSFSKREEIEGRIRHFLFDTGSPLGLWQGQKEAWMRQLMADSLIFGDSNKNRRHKTIYQIPTMKMGNLQIENYPLIVEDAMKDKDNPVPNIEPNKPTVHWSPLTLLLDL